MKLVATGVGSAAEMPPALPKPLQGELAARFLRRTIVRGRTGIQKRDDNLRLFDSLGNLGQPDLAVAIDAFLRLST